jgi:hypothetical protein
MAVDHEGELVSEEVECGVVCDGECPCEHEWALVEKKKEKARGGVGEEEETESREHVFTGEGLHARVCVGVRVGACVRWRAFSRLYIAPAPSSTS